MFTSRNVSLTRSCLSYLLLKILESPSQLWKIGSNGNSELAGLGPITVLSLVNIQIPFLHNHVRNRYLY